jgi:hypothetical protein
VCSDNESNVSDNNGFVGVVGVVVVDDDDDVGGDVKGADCAFVERFLEIAYRIPDTIWLVDDIGAGDDADVDADVDADDDDADDDDFGV